MTRKLAILLCVLSLTGCSSSAPPRYFSLASSQTAVSLDRTAAAKPRIGLAAISLPELVDRPQLVVHSGAHQVTIVQDQRWGEPLKQAIPRFLAQHLARRLNNPWVAAFPQQAAVDPDYQVQVDFQRIDGRLGAEVIVEASWTIRGRGGKLLGSGRPLVREPVASGDYEGLVAAYVQALSRLGDDLADRLQSLPAPTR